LLETYAFFFVKEIFFAFAHPLFRWLRLISLSKTETYASFCPVFCDVSSFIRSQIEQTPAPLLHHLTKQLKIVDSRRFR